MLRWITEGPNHGASDVLVAFLDHRQAVSPTCPMSSVCSAFRTPEAQPSHAQWKAADFPCLVVRDLSEEDIETLPNAGVMLQGERSGE